MTWAFREFRCAFQTVSDQGRRVKQKEYLPNGALAVVDQGEARVGGYTNDLSMKVNGTGPFIVFGDHTRRIKYVDFDFAVGADGVKVLRPADDLDPKFAYWFLQSVRLPDRGYGRHFALLRETPVPLPSPEEQRRIVEILEDHLSRLDAADAYLATAQQRLGALATAGLWDATHDLPDTRPLALEQIAEVRLGRQRSPKNHTGERMRPYLRAANVGWDELRLDDVYTMQFAEAEENIYRLEPGDILLTEASGSPAEVGKSVLYEGLPAGVCFQNTLLRVRCHSANPAFVQKYLLAEARAGRFMPEARGVGINHLGRARLAALPVALPPARAQEYAVARCGDLIESVVRLRAELDAAVRRLAVLRRSLLAAAFSGRLTERASDLSVELEMIPT